MKLIYSTVKRHIFVFLMIMIVQAMALFSIVFSYGVMLNNQYELNKREDDLKYLNFFSKDSALKAKDFIANIPNISKKNKNFPIKGIIVLEADTTISEEMLSKENTTYINEDGSPGINKMSVTAEIFYENGQLVLSDQASDTWGEDSYLKGEKVCRVNQTIRNILGNTITLQGEQYTIVGGIKDSFLDDVYMPITSINDNMKVSYVSLDFDRELTHSEYNLLKTDIESCYEGAALEFQDYCSLNVDEKAKLKTMKYIAALMIGLSLITMLLLYKYILSQCKKQLAVYFLCGKSKITLISLFSTLIFAVILLSDLITYFIFKLVLMKKLSKVFVWFEIIFSNYNIEYMFSIVGMILGLFSIIFTYMFFRKNPYEMWRKQKIG